MITAIDTNILLDILVPNEHFFETSANALQDAGSRLSGGQRHRLRRTLHSFRDPTRVRCFPREQRNPCTNLGAGSPLPRKPRMADLSSAGRKADQNPGGLSNW